MATKNLLVKNIPFDRVRAVITASQSGSLYTYYSEGEGNRYYVNAVSSTASPVMESADFTSYLSFTQSSGATFWFDLIPMDKGNSAIINTVMYAQNLQGTKGYVQKSFGAYKHTGTTLTHIGAGMDNTHESDFATGQLQANWSAGATQSIRLTCSNTTGDVVDWDIHIHYKKGFHSIASGTVPPIGPIYPEKPSAVS